MAPLCLARSGRASLLELVGASSSAAATLTARSRCWVRSTAQSSSSPVIPGFPAPRSPPLRLQSCQQPSWLCMRFVLLHLFRASNSTCAPIASPLSICSTTPPRSAPTLSSAGPCTRRGPPSGSPLRSPSATWTRTRAMSSTSSQTWLRRWALLAMPLAPRLRPQPTPLPSSPSASCSATCFLV